MTKRVVSAGQRRSEVMIATLFVVTGVVAITGAFVLMPILNPSNYLALVYPNRGGVEAGSLLWSINNIGIVFIAVFAFPVLRKVDEALAAGYLASRIIEGTIMMGGIVAYLLLIPLSQQFISAGSPSGSWFLSYADILKQASYLGLTQLANLMLGLGGLIFTSLLFRFRLVHRYVAVLGLIGYTLLFVASIAGWFGLLDETTGSPATVLVLPVAVFEIVVLPAWLFLRGFRMPQESVRA